MKQWKKSAVLAVPMALLCSVSAFAGQWEEEGVTWKYLQDDGSYAADVWQWIDSDGDGLAECYHFNEDGWVDLNTVVYNWLAVSYTHLLAGRSVVY